MKHALVPSAMLLDFGGVLVDVHHRGLGIREIAAEVHELLRRRRTNSVDAGRVERDIRAGWQAYDDWKRAQGRRAAPREISHREFWEDFVAADWPAPARAVVVSEASALCRRLDVATKDRPAKADSLELLRALRVGGIKAGCVSNALAGAGSRELQERYGFAPYLETQVYSDEAGMRKPHPGIFARAAAELGVALGDCWYVGDTLDRDVLGARRAGVGRVILMPSGETERGIDVVTSPDDVIRRPLELLDLLAATAR